MKNSLSPLDGRYQETTKPLSQYFSEFSLIFYRIKIETLYLKALSKSKIIRSLTQKEIKILDNLTKPSKEFYKKVKEFEKKTHHDVKAVEYSLRSELEKTSLKNITSFIHFAITSDDINNLSYRLMVKDSCQKVMFPILLETLQNLTNISEKHQNLPILARTHGQPAIPTTLGKEFCVYALRLQKKLEKLFQIKLVGKFNGAIGSYNAMNFSYPNINWQQFSKKLIEDLNLEFLELTTQINPNDDFVELFSILQQINTVLINLNQDIWRYISDDWLIQKDKEKFVGSSTMPQKINPIEFENSEGNLSLANSILNLFINKLPISRLQRDLSNSTILRNIGSGFGYCLIAYKSLNKGLIKLEANEDKIKNDLNQNWNILTEALQTQARKNGDQKAYEKASKIGKNKIISKKDWQNLTKDLDDNLKNLTPRKYTGLSENITKKSIIKLKQFNQLKKGYL